MGQAPDLPAALPVSGSNPGLPVVVGAAPTALPSSTPSAEPTATVEPSQTPSSTPTVASTATVVPATHTPMPSPTATVTPLPTQTATLPPTATPVHVAASSPPTRIRIPAIQVDSAVVEIYWQTFVDHHGNQVTGWKVADYAAGWHLAPPIRDRPKTA